MMCIDRELEHTPTAPRAVINCMYFAGIADWIAETNLEQACEVLEIAEENYKIVEASGDYDPCLPALRAGLEAARATLEKFESIGDF